MRHLNVVEQPQGHGKKQILIALNVNELELLASMASKIASTLPDTGTTKRLHSVAKSMAKEMHKSVRVLEAEGRDKRSTDRFPKDDRAVM